tara:strand:- start:256 stop:678 length:423 start_codon:yes stop_codon:yes gene_type:complete
MLIPDKKHKTLIKCYALKSNHIYCKIELNNVQGIFLIDSGASNSCIDIERQDKFRLDKFKKSYSASGAGNEKFDAFKTKKGEFSYKKKMIDKLNFLLIDMGPINSALNKTDEVSIDGIIGADFLLKNNVILNFKKITLYV